MREQVGDLWELAGPEDILVITTNGFVRKDGAAVMGRGIALQATQRDPDIAARLGQLINKFGNHVHLLQDLWDYPDRPAWLSFPVKHHWKDKADIDLIERSTQELVQLIDSDFYLSTVENIYMPRPGCGNGRLKWEDVKPVIEPYLDDKFIVVNYA